MQVLDVGRLGLHVLKRLSAQFALERGSGGSRVVNVRRSCRKEKEFGRLRRSLASTFSLVRFSLEVNRR